MDVSFFQEMLSKISERGRQILDLPSLITPGGQETFESLCKALVSSRGEASGVALARRVLDRYKEASPEEKDAIFAFIASHFVPQGAGIEKVIPPGKSFSAVSILRRTEPRTWFTCGRTSLRG